MLNIAGDEQRRHRQGGQVCGGQHQEEKGRQDIETRREGSGFCVMKSIKIYVLTVMPFASLIYNRFHVIN